MSIEISRVSSAEAPSRQATSAALCATPTESAAAATPKPISATMTMVSPAATPVATACTTSGRTESPVPRQEVVESLPAQLVLGTQQAMSGLRRSAAEEAIFAGAHTLTVRHFIDVYAAATGCSPDANVFAVRDWEFVPTGVSVPVEPSEAEVASPATSSRRNGRK